LELRVAYTWEWIKNEEFLKGVVQRGDDVIFAGKYDPTRIDVNSTLCSEINYLLSHGYELASDFSKLTLKL
jgi:hypothetical protein